MNPGHTLVFLQLTLTNVPQVAPAPNEHSELMLGQLPPRVKHSCMLLAAVHSVLLLTFNTPVALVVSTLTRFVAELPLKVAAVTLPAQFKPETTQQQQQQQLTWMCRA
jgi:hypothetical protein